MQRPSYFIYEIKYTVLSDRLNVKTIKGGKSQVWGSGFGI